MPVKEDMVFLSLLPPHRGGALAVWVVDSHSKVDVQVHLSLVGSDRMRYPLLEEGTA